MFSLDEDICLVDYKKYYDTPDHSFPVLSFCLKNPFSDEKLQSEYSNATPKSYGKFLLGKNYSESMLGVNYSNVLLDAWKYANRYFIHWRNGTIGYITISNATDRMLVSSLAGSWGYQFYQCYSLHIPPNKDINSLAIEINNDIFPDRVRTNKFSFITMIHTKNQLLLSGTSFKFKYPRREPNDSYVLRYKIKGVELIKRRNKKNSPCYKDWTNYDGMIHQDHSKSLGCTPPYFKSIANIPRCSNEDQMAASPFEFRYDDYGKSPPCEGFQSIDYYFEEHVIKDLNFEVAQYKRGHFWIGLYIYDQKFKEITQIKAIDFNALIGYIGGYIGLILGYSILNIPEYIVLLIEKFKAYYLYDSGIRVNVLPVSIIDNEGKRVPDQKHTNQNSDMEKELRRHDREIEIIKEYLNRNHSL